jgi:hypothetical protein
MRCLLIFLLLTSGGSVFAMSPIEEAFVIRNYSSKVIIINVEYSDDPGKRFYDESSWQQNVNGINLTFYSHLSKASEFRLRPYQVITILSYYPMGNTDGHGAYTRLDRIPFLGKMKSVYKSLRIATEDGEKVITLENLGEQIIKKNVGSGGIAYYLEIFNYDLVGKPGSEW